MMAFLASPMFVGCSDEDEDDFNPDELQYTNEDVAELLAESLITGGLTSSFASLASYASSFGVALKGNNDAFALNESCGQTDSFVEPFSVSESGFTTEGQYSYSYTLNCAGDVPTSVSSEIALTAFSSGSGVTTSIAYLLDATLGNLSGEGPFTLEGYIDWESIIYSVDTGDVAFDYTWTITGGLLDRTTYELVGGSGTIDMLIESIGSDEIIEATATYTVASNGTITMTINGETFTVDPSTGEVL